jgi:hypothetical protein
MDGYAGCLAWNEVGAPLVGAQRGPIRPGQGRHEACPYVVIAMRKA